MPADQNCEENVVLSEECTCGSATAQIGQACSSSQQVIERCDSTKNCTDSVTFRGLCTVTSSCVCESILQNDQICIIDGQNLKDYGICGNDAIISEKFCQCGTELLDVASSGMICHKDGDSLVIIQQCDRDAIITNICICNSSIVDTELNVAKVCYFDQHKQEERLITQCSSQYTLQPNDCLCCDSNATNIALAGQYCSSTCSIYDQCLTDQVLNAACICVGTSSNLASKGDSCMESGEVFSACKKSVNCTEIDGYSSYCVTQNGQQCVCATIFENDNQICKIGSTNQDLITCSYNSVLSGSILCNCNGKIAKAGEVCKCETSQCDSATLVKNCADPELVLTTCQCGTSSMNIRYTTEQTCVDDIIYNNCSPNVITATECACGQKIAQLYQSCSGTDIIPKCVSSTENDAVCIQYNSDYPLVCKVADDAKCACSTVLIAGKLCNTSVSGQNRDVSDCTNSAIAQNTCNCHGQIAEQNDYCGNDGVVKQCIANSIITSEICQCGTVSVNTAELQQVCTDKYVIYSKCSKKNVSFITEACWCGKDETYKIADINDICQSEVLYRQCVDGINYTSDSCICGTKSFLLAATEAYCNNSKASVTNPCPDEGNIYFNSTGTKCVSKCDKKQFISVDSMICLNACPEGQVISFDGAQCRLSCGENAEVDSSNVCYCSTGAILDVNGQNCLTSCPSGQFSSITGYQCLSQCGLHQTIQNNTSCHCDKKYKISGQKCVKTGLSGGAIAGIIIACIIAVALVVCIAYCFSKKKKVVSGTVQPETKTIDEMKEVKENEKEAAKDNTFGKVEFGEEQK